MKGKKVIYGNDIYLVIHDYGNGYMEIKKENERYKVELVKKEEVQIISA